MKIVHFFPESRGTRFLGKFQKFLAANYSQIYTGHKKSKDFFLQLDERINHSDVIVITAHGTEDSIIGDEVQGEPLVLGIDEFHRFKNSFVFSFSCSTGVLGEIICTEKRAISFLGFNDVIDLVVDSGKRIFSDELSSIVKGIYNEALEKSFIEFIGNNYTVGEFSKSIARNLMASYVSILEMTSEEIADKYSISRRAASNEIFGKIIKTDLLTTLDSVKKRIIVHGESMFIPWIFIDGKNTEKIEGIIRKLNSVDYIYPFNSYYRFFLLGLLYRLLGNTELAQRNFSIAKKFNSNFAPLNEILGNVTYDKNIG